MSFSILTLQKTNKLLWYICYVVCRVGVYKSIQSLNQSFHNHDVLLYYKTKQQLKLKSRISCLFIFGTRLEVICRYYLASISYLKNFRYLILIMREFIILSMFFFFFWSQKKKKQLHSALRHLNMVSEVYQLHLQTALLHLFFCYLMDIVLLISNPHHTVQYLLYRPHLLLFLHF